MVYRIRLAFEAIFHKSATLQDVHPDPEGGVEVSRRESIETPTMIMTPASPGPFKKVQLVSVMGGCSLPFTDIIMSPLF